ncbi:unnamed protein product [Allacma fusca]|uniref:C2H2-type domain-containing protein n=1 Tax=Allacma fusca TaxID=39272 RepID=A0A8J2PL24_9HEXA|nr:unnamed protein product [Allacma fusca]
MTSTEIVASIFGQFEDFLRNVGKMDIFETLVYNYRLKPAIYNLSPEFTDLLTQLLDKLIELRNSLVSWRSLEQFTLSVSDSLEKLDDPNLPPVEGITGVVMGSFGNNERNENYMSYDDMASVDIMGLNNTSNFLLPNQNEIREGISVDQEAGLPQNEENLVEKGFLCQVCGKKYATTQSLNAHLNVHTHTRKFPCKYCAKVFTRKDKMIFHESIHTGIKSFICEICGKSFSRKTKLDEHLRRHSGLKKYKCDRCSKSYASHRDLRNHLAKHEVVTASLAQLESAGIEPRPAATTEEEALTNEVTEIFKLNWPELHYPSEPVPESYLDPSIPGLNI